MAVKLMVAGLALALAASPVAMAQAAGEFVVAEGEEALAQEIQAFIGDGGDLSGLSDAELKKRLRAARGYLGNRALPNEFREPVSNIYAAAREETARRAAAPKKEVVQEDKPAEEPVEKTPEKSVEEAPAEERAPAPELAEFLGDDRAAEDLDAQALRKRIATASGLLKDASVPGKQRGRIAAIRKADIAALRAREAAAKEEQPKAEEKTAEEEPEAKPAEAEIPAELAGLLADGRPVADLSETELQGRIKTARPYLKDPAVPAEYRRRATKLYQDAAVEIRKRRASAEKKPEEPKAEEPVDAQGEPNAAAAKFLADSRPASELSGEELDQRAKTAGKLFRDKSLSQEQRAQVGVVLKDARREFLARRDGGKPKTEEPPKEEAVADPKPAPEEEKPKTDAALDGNEADAAAEAKAKEFLADGRKIEAMKEEDGRARLDAIRDLLAENALSSGTERALRKKLRDDREVFRTRLAERQAEEAPAEPAVKKGAEPAAGAKQEKEPEKKRRKPKFNLDIKVILGDQRPSRDLEEDELQQRIEAYRDAVEDESYEADDRDTYRESLARDRRLLRERKLAGRRERAQRYAEGDFGEEDDIAVENEYSARTEVKRKEIFAAEADDEEIERQLKAPPRKPLKRKITVEEIASAPDLREAMPAIDIDTIRFGFNESTVREEELENLDRIGAVIEKILARRPNEVFLVEGHTDAVGSDSYNVALSKKRAAAVREALSTYYVIPEKNLKIAGYGERFLKIPTSDPEEENRRVGIRRVTPLLSEVDDL